MDVLIPIRCQENCPIGKKCCFGEVYAESLGERPLRERHKCHYSKSTGKEFVDTKTEKSVA